MIHIHGLFFKKGMTNLDMFNDISVLKNLPSKSDSLGLNNLEWFTNSELDNINKNDTSTLSIGAIVGIVIGVAVSMSLVFFFLWKKFKGFRRIVWNKR